MAGGKEKVIIALGLIVLALILDLTSYQSPLALGQLLISFAFAIAGALVGIRGLVDFLAERC